MNKPELLSPAGNMAALKAAIHNSADAVYISGKNFGARKFAPNFNQDELIEAINYAHLYDVKIYVTVNTIIYENEVDDCLNYLAFLYNHGVDAVIMQDIGMIKLTREYLPDLEIHISTQANTCNDEALKLYKSLGIQRAVLARELSLEEINNLKTGIEKEVFIHGALCICYSGCCLFSSFEGGRSGNRGECAGPCRLPYKLICNHKEVSDWEYFLSTKELNTSHQIKQILNSNIQSLKIEGRMKSPEYVGFVTKMYRELIDTNHTTNTEKDLKKLFNRDFTEGHLFQQKNEKLINKKSPNHIGIPLGKVLEISKKIKIKLIDNLSQNDGIRFQESHKGMIVNKLYDNQGLLINQAKKGDIIYLDNKIDLKSLDNVRKTTDSKLIDELKKYPLKKMPINFKVTAKIGKPLTISIKDKQRTITKHGNIVSPAITTPVTTDNIHHQLTKLGNTPFTCTNITIEADQNIFIPLKEINDLRRQLIDALTQAKKHVNRKPVKPQLTLTQKTHSNKTTINAFVTNEEQLTTLIDKVNNIYTDNYDLYLKYKSAHVFFTLDRTNKKLPDFNHENLLLTELGGIYKYPQNNNCFADYTLNVVNGYSADFLMDHNLKQITISPEMTLTQIKDLAKHGNNLEIIIYGRIELMVMHHKLTPNNNYLLKNKQNKTFPIINKNNQTHIFSQNKINLINELQTLKNMGINNFRINLSDENPQEILNILNKIKTS